jgi:hypothetical protein
VDASIGRQGGLSKLARHFSGSSNSTLLQASPHDCSCAASPHHCHLLPTRLPSRQVEAKIMKEQRRMILMEQLKSIKRELGLEKDDKASLIGAFTAKWEPKKDAAPEEVRK